MSPIEVEIIRRKLAIITENLAALKPIETIAEEEYIRDIYKRKATERLLQELIEAAIDINSHIIVQTGNTAPDDYYESFIKAGELGIIPSTLAERLAPSAGLRNRLVHEYVDVNMVEPTAGLVEAFPHMPLEHAVVTHGAHIWACKAIAHLGLSKWFPHERLHALENFDFQYKSGSRVPFEKGLDSLGHESASVLMVEDTIHNLKVPHQMGMTTILITQGRAVNDLPGYVDFVCHDAVELLTHVKNVRG